MTTKIIKERCSCSKVFCKEGVLGNFAKLLRTPFFKEYLWWLLLKKVNADEATLQCSVAVGEENVSGEA